VQGAGNTHLGRIIGARAGRTIAHSPALTRLRLRRAFGDGRKVRTPQDSAPGNARGPDGQCIARRATESATEKKPPAGNRFGGGREAKPCVRIQARSQVRVKRRGKSSPPEWRHSGHGKPRAEQGQIGGPQHL